MDAVRGCGGSGRAESLQTTTAMTREVPRGYVSMHTHHLLACVLVLGNFVKGSRSCALFMNLLFLLNICCRMDPARAFNLNYRMETSVLGSSGTKGSGTGFSFPLVVDCTSTFIKFRSVNLKEISMGVL